MDPAVLPRSTPRVRGKQERREPTFTRRPNDIVAVLGIDLGKNVFHIIGLDKRGGAIT